MFGRATIGLGIGPHSSFLIAAVYMVNKAEYITMMMMMTCQAGGRRSAALRVAKRRRA